MSNPEAADGPAPNVRQIIHDLRNSLFAIQMGIAVLGEVRDQNPEQFDHILRQMSAEHADALRLLDALSQAAHSTG